MKGLTEAALKSRLAAHGACVPVGRVVRSGDEVTHGDIASPMMVKALVPLKDRAKLGLVRRAADVREAAIATAEILANGAVRVDEVLIEAAAGDGDEYYLAAAFDYVAGEPIVLLGTGGSGVEHRDEKPRAIRATMDGTVAVEEIPAPLRPVVDAMFAEFLNLRAQFIELNPVRIVDGNAIVLDAKAALDPAVEAPHDAVDISAEDEVGALLREEAAAMKGGTEVRFGRLDGDIGLVTAGGGVLAIVHDALRKHGLRPANFADVSGGSATTAILGSVAREVVKLKPRGVLVITGITSSISVEHVAETMLTVLAPLAALDPAPPIVARMAGIGEGDAARILAALPNCRTVGKDVTVDEVVDLLAAALVKP